MARRQQTRRERRRDRTLRDRLPALQEGPADAARPQANPLAALGGRAIGWTPLIEQLVTTAQQQFHDAAPDGSEAPVMTLPSDAELERAVDHAA